MVVEIVSPPGQGMGYEFLFLPLVEDLCRAESGFAADWHVEPPSEPDGTWIAVRHAHTATPAQGWKLHVSATVASAPEVLRRVLPILLAEDANFKTAASLRMLKELNNQADGAALSQIGKFVTIYPNDDAQAVRLAVALDAATAGLPGPAVPSDRPLRPGSLVHYRYGGFGVRHFQTLGGELTFAIVAPDGELIPDRRLPAYEPPAWANDPFLAAGVAGELPPVSPLVADRYLLVATLHASPRGAVHLAVDIATPRPCVLKQARRHGAASLDGRDARDRLRHEAAVLARLAPDPRFPTPYDLVEQDGDLFLAMTDMEGTTLANRLADQVARGTFVPTDQVVAWGREVAAMLGAIHAAGLVYGDIKANNIVAGYDGRLGLIDFELSYAPDDSNGRHGRGTRGYMSPQQEAGRSPIVADDIYALGALLFGLATNAEPSSSPNPTALLERPPALLNPAVDPTSVAVIARCLAPDPDDRFQTMAAVDAALDAVLTGHAASTAAFGAEPNAEPEGAARARAATAARRLGDTLRATARESTRGNGVFWTSESDAHRGIRSRDVSAGSGGALLALAELVAAADEPAHRDILAAGARWLSGAPRPAGPPVAGLYVGEAGVGAALLRAGQVLADPALIAAAADRGRFVAGQPFASPDLFNGTAGRLRFHLLLWDETGEPDHRRHAVAAGEALLSAAEGAGNGGLSWQIPAGYDGMSGKTYLGYAHGAAGIADALLDLTDAIGDERFLAAARGASRWLRRLATPFLEDGQGLSWSITEDGQPAAPFWCHGSAGIGRFFLHLAAFDGVEATEIAARAARAAARGARWAGPTQCHGLAGNIEFLLDVYRATSDPAYLAEARGLARLLDAFAIEREEGLAWWSDLPGVVAPDYMVGYAGIAVCLLRLADPERRPHQLSRAGFRYA